MKFANEFILRAMGAQEGGSIIPLDRNAVDDVIATRVITRLGSQQTYIDIARCYSVSSSIINKHLPHYCTALAYLDVSYTKCDDLTQIFLHCQGLRSLNAAGLTFLVHDLQGIGNLYQLEALSLRSSSITDIRALDNLPLLRSLDLGCTTLRKIDKAFTNKKRLEEILFDYCQLSNTEAILDAIPQLESLKVMNLHGSNLLDSEIFIRDLAVGPIYFEKMCRRLLFFQALADNKYHEAYRYLTSGIDINIRAQHEDDTFFAQLWYKRAYYAKTKLAAPFFPVNAFTPSQAEFHPTPLHIALYFNSLECVKFLLEQNADREALVYISNVSLDHRKKKLFEKNTSSTTTVDENDGVTKKANDIDDVTHLKIVTSNQLIQYVYQRNIHRLTDDLIGRKVPNWKIICNQYRKRLMILVDSFLKGKEMSMKELESITATTKLSNKKDGNDIEGGDEEGDGNAPTGAENELINLEITSKPSTPGTGLKANATITATNATNTTKTSPSRPRSGSPSKRPTSPSKQSTKAATAAAAASNDAAEGNNRGNTSPSRPGSPPKTPKQKTRERPPLLPALDKVVQWYDHGLVYKLVRPTTTIILNEPTSNNPEDELNNTTGTGNWMLPSSSMGMSMNESRDFGSMIGGPTGTAGAAGGGATKQPKVAKRRQSSLQLAIAKSRDEVQSTDSLLRTSSRSTTRFTSSSGSMKLSPFLITAGQLTTTTTNTNINTNTATIPTAVEESSGVISTKFAINEINVLGKKEFWLESRTQTILENLVTQEEEYEAIQAQQDILTLTREMKKQPTLMMKKKLFLEGLQERFDAKMAAKDQRSNAKKKK